MGEINWVITIQGLAVDDKVLLIIAQEMHSKELVFV